MYLIHPFFFLGRPCFLLRSPYANIISFSNPSDRMTCPKNLNFALSTVCCLELHYQKTKFNKPIQVFPYQPYHCKKLFQHNYTKAGSALVLKSVSVFSVFFSAFY